MTDIFALTQIDTTPLYCFDPGDGFRYRNTDFAWVATHAEGHVLEQRDGTRLQQAFTHKQLDDMFHEKEPLEYLRKRYVRGSDHTTFKEEGLTATLSEKKAARLVWRDKICNIVLKLELEGELSRSDASLNEHLPRICKQIGVTKDVKKKSYKNRKVEIPSASTVRRWLRLYEGTQQIVSLTDNYKGRPGSTTFCVDVIELMEKHAKRYASSDRPKMNELYDDLVEELEDINKSKKGLPGFVPLKAPKIKAFRKRIHDLGVLRICAGRKNTKVAQQAYAAMMEGITVYRPLQRVEMDEYLTDLQTVLSQMGIWQTLTLEERKKVPKMRLWITAILDTASRTALAVHVHSAAPSIRSAVAGVEMATRDKSEYARRLGCSSSWEMHGSFEEIAVDSASWYISLIFYLMIRDLGAHLSFPPTGAASARGTMERFFKTVSGQAFSGFPGRTWSNPKDLGEGDPVKEAGILLEMVRPLITRFVVDVYHHTPHLGLALETPYNAWRRLRAQHKVRPSPTGAQRRHIFGTSLTCKVTAAGFSAYRVGYQDVGLQKLRRGKKKEVLVRVEPGNLGAASYYDGTVWRTARAKDPDFEGMSLFEWLAIVDAAKNAGLSEAELTKPIRRAALADLREAGLVAKQMAGLPDPQLSDQDFEKLQARLEQGDRKVMNVNTDHFARDWQPSEEYLDLFGLGRKLVRDKSQIELAAETARREQVEQAIAEAHEPAKMASGKSLIIEGYN